MKIGPINIGQRQFSAPVWALMLYLAVALCMLLLARWQLLRADEKIALHAAASEARLATPTELQRIDDVIAAAVRYQRVQLTGRYLPQRQFLWDNRTHQGQAGYEVIIPVKLSTGQLALVNRGWLPVGASRAVLPDVQIPESLVSIDIPISGFLTRPSRGFASGAALDDGAAWPLVLQYLDYDAIAAVLAEPIIPAVVQVQELSKEFERVAIDTDSDNAGASDAGASAAGTAQGQAVWLQANWQPAASGPEKHYSYAFQWFAMAFALTILFVVVNTRKVDS